MLRENPSKFHDSDLKVIFAECIVASEISDLSEHTSLKIWLVNLVGFQGNQKFQSHLGNNQIHLS